MRCLVACEPAVGPSPCALISHTSRRPPALPLRPRPALPLSPHGAFAPPFALPYICVCYLPRPAGPDRGQRGRVPAPAHLLRRTVLLLVGGRGVCVWLGDHLLLYLCSRELRSFICGGRGLLHAGRSGRRLTAHEERGGLWEWLERLECERNVLGPPPLPHFTRHNTHAPHVLLLPPSLL